MKIHLHTLALGAALLVPAAWPTAALAADPHRQALQKAIPQIQEKFKVPGVSIAVFQNFKIVWAQGFGVANADTKKPVDIHTLFQAASISKPIAGIATLQLVRAGKLDLDRNVNAYLKSWHLPENELTQDNPVTLRRLMSHTAGTNVHGFKGYAAGVPVPTVQQVLDGLPPANSEAVRVTMKPGAQLEYSGGGTTIMQLMVTELLNEPYPAIVKRMVLDRIGMKESTYEQPLPASRLAVASAGHEGGVVIPGERHTYPEMAAAGLYTTASDLARAGIALQKARLGKNDKLLSKELALAMTTAVSPVKEFNFGLGFELFRKEDDVRRFFGHTGGNAGYICWLLATVDGGNGFAVMTNGDKWEPVGEIGKKAIAEYGW
jgi:CubicO group peptidase (beta-lactamase class C family)